MAGLMETATGLAGRRFGFWRFCQLVISTLRYEIFRRPAAFSLLAVLPISGTIAAFRQKTRAQMRLGLTDRTDRTGFVSFVGGWSVRFGSTFVLQERFEILQRHTLGLML
jgi:hypothetical protein